ncbi:MAG: choice-of-anchor D domain-containing protein [Longimonas sp.]|uniref:choice-of-anchor D domain-containing protein n=1 Tax=Longimonas sp. TaxID=2039626 RepID=UPI003362D5CC
MSQPGVEPNNTSSIVSGTRGFQKGEADPLAGEGHPVLLGAGGPDEFGYTWIDSNEEGGPTFSWVDISEDGEALPIGDEEIETVDLPFEFPFYGDTFSEIDVGDNGAVTFTGELPEFITSEIPGDGTPSIAPFWFDLDPSEGGEIYAYADEENNRFIIQYDEVPPWTFGETEDAFTFQIILTENGAIRYQYLDMDGVTDPASIGIQNLDGSDGLQIAFNTEYVENELAIDIEAAPDFIVDVNPASGSLAGGDSDDVSITLDADGVEPDIYEDELTLTTNDPDAESTLIPFDITVDGGAAEIAVDSEALSFDDVVAGESATETLTIENTGSTPLAGSVSLEDEAEVFSLTEGAGDYALGPDETQEVEVTFAPEEDASFEGTVAISHNADNEPDPVEVSLTGDGLAPSIAVDPEALSFDDVVAGESATETVTIENTGSAPLEGSVSLDVDTDAFELSEGEGDYALGPDETQDVEVTFAPDEAASFEGTVSITHNAGNEPDPVDVPLTGESVASAIAVNPEAINFDNVAAGESVTETVTIENTGSAPLEGSISLDADTDAFDLTEGEGDYSLAPDETQEVDVTFEPEEAASFEGTLSISHNADNEPDPLSVAISGEATPAEPVITQELDDVELVAGAAATTWDLTEFVEPPATSPDPLTFSASSTFPALVDVDVENSTLSATPLAVGIASITVTAETEEGGAATLDFEADVNALRAAPTIAFDDPRATASYRLTGLPGQIDEDVAATLSGDPDTGWRVFRDPGTEEDDLEAYDGSDAFRFAPGRGFWMLSREDWAVDTTVDPVALDEDSTTTVPLQEGWNILSNPLDRSVAWDATLGLAANDGLTESLWQWDGGWSESGTFTSAREGTAFYLFNDAELDALTLAHPDAEAPSSEAPVVAATTEEAETLQFTATLESGEAGNENQVEDIELGTVTLGYAPETRATRMPPAHFLPAQFSVRSEEADEEAAFSRLLKEPASGMNADEDGHAFDLRLEPAAGEMASTEAHSDETSPEEQTAKLALSEALTSEQFPGDEALLIGADGTRYDLREMDAGETVPVTLADEPAELRVLIGSEAFIDDELEVPDEITFGPAYPNPSRGPVTVEVALPSDAEAEIVLYDMLGRRVATVHEGELQRGLNEVQWSGDNLASGMYFLRLQTEGQTFTEKVVRVR